MIERVIPLDSLVDSILQFSGLAVLGRPGAIDLRIERNTLRSPAVPRSLSGFRILQLSDASGFADRGDATVAGGYFFGGLLS